MLGKTFLGLAILIGAASSVFGQTISPVDNLRQSPNEFVQSGSSPTCAQCWENVCQVEPGRHYFSTFAGFTDVDNFERTLRVGRTKRVEGAKLKDGWGAGAAVGRRWNEYCRLEFEFSYRENSVESWREHEFTLGNNAFNETQTLTSFSEVPATGAVHSYSGVANLLFDLSDRNIGYPSLYLGGGLGSLYVSTDFTSAANAYQSNDSSFAYQFIAGIDYPVRKQVAVYSEYRYLGADYLNVQNLTTAQSLGDFSFDSHSIFFGVRLGQ